jgi:MFS family permease
VTPLALLAVTFAMGFGVALNGPAWQAVISELVPREELPAAVALNSVGFNLARARRTGARRTRRRRGRSRARRFS